MIEALKSRRHLIDVGKAFGAKLPIFLSPENLPHSNDLLQDLQNDDVFDSADFRDKYESSSFQIDFF